MKRCGTWVEWIGMVGGVCCWFGAHETGFYFSHYNCWHPWILSTTQMTAFFVCALITVFLFRRRQRNMENGSAQSQFILSINTMVAGLFTVVILWQGIATFFYTGCER